MFENISLNSILLLFFNITRNHICLLFNQRRRCASQNTPCENLCPAVPLISHVLRKCCLSLANIRYTQVELIMSLSSSPKLLLIWCCSQVHHCSSIQQKICWPRLCYIINCSLNAFNQVGFTSNTHYLLNKIIVNAYGYLFFK